MIGLLASLACGPSPGAGSGSGSADSGASEGGPSSSATGSASASEIFAGVIKDYNRGLIIGDSSTFGKGTVQSVIELNRYFLPKDGAPDLGALKLTIQQFYRANGDSTQINGVSPHVHLPSIRDYMDFGESKMDNALKFEKA